MGSIIVDGSLKRIDSDVAKRIQTLIDFVQARDKVKLIPQYTFQGMPQGEGYVKNKYALKQEINIVIPNAQALITNHSSKFDYVAVILPNMQVFHQATAGVLDSRTWGITGYFGKNANNMNVMISYGHDWTPVSTLAHEWMHTPGRLPSLTWYNKYGMGHNGSFNRELEKFGFEKTP